MSCTDDGVGAVAPSCAEPGRKQLGTWGTKMRDIFDHTNLQWHGKPAIGEESVVEAEHLYSTFIYRKSAASHGYRVSSLSSVGHREETIFTHEMHRAGHRLLINRDAMVWHLRGDVGGIRSHNNQSLWEMDERFFLGLCQEWGITPREVLHINLDAGRGDHYMFKMAFDRIRENNPDKSIVVYSAHPEWLSDIDGIEVLSVKDGRDKLRGWFDDINIYAWCMKNNWQGSIVDAFVHLYKSK
jgi:hypothetical protein